MGPSVLNSNPFTVPLYASPSLSIELFSIFNEKRAGVVHRSQRIAPITNDNATMVNPIQSLDFI